MPPDPKRPTASIIFGNQNGPIQPQVDRTKLKNTPMLAECSLLQSTASIHVNGISKYAYARDICGGTYKLREL